MLQFSLKKLRVINYFLLALILIATLFTARALISFFAYEDTGISSVPAADAPSGNTARSADVMQYSSIVIKNPFGPPMIYHTITPADDLKPETEYVQEISPDDLTLVGTVVGPDNMSYAIFEGNAIASANRQEVFAHGDAIYNYGTLDEILSDSVVIRQGADTHKLKLIKSFNNAIATPVNVTTSNNSNPAQPFVKRVGKREYQLDKKQVEESIEHPEKILTDARLLPNFVNGQQEGYKISEVKPGGLYENIGLKNGDVLLRVNSLEISSPEVAIQTMSALRGANSINLDIIRNKSRMSLSYKIK